MMMVKIWVDGSRLMHIRRVWLWSERVAKQKKVQGQVVACINLKSEVMHDTVAVPLRLLGSNLDKGGGAWYWCGGDGCDEVKRR